MRTNPTSRRRGARHRRARRAGTRRPRPRARPHVPKAPRGAGLHDVQANLWEWNWNSVARECETVLGPSGYGGVQVAPPADSLSRDYTTSDAPILHPWWEVYQPVDYRLTSRFGTSAEFTRHGRRAAAPPA